MARTIAPGDVLADRYVIRRSEWTSAVGPVWSARDKVLDRSVLVQVLAPALASNAAARRAFQKAAGRAAQVAHPGVLQVFDIGDDPAFVVFEHAKGGRLSDRVSAGPMRTTDAARIALSLARGLEALHERGTWHGALSPAAVLLDEEGRAKVLPTGEAETLRVSGGAATTEQPASYRPPQDAALPADADRYALAALTFHMFTGREPPGRGASARALRRSVPEEIDRLLRRALSHDPADRPTLDEFIGQLAPFARVVPREAREPRFGASELRWLVPVILIVLIAAAAATLGVRFVQDIAAREERPSPTPTAARPRGAPIPIAEVEDFDPQGGGRFPRQENRPLVPRATDGDPRTSWRTVDYRTADLSGKDGVGLVFDLGDRRTVRSLRVQSTLPGWSAEIRVADERALRASGYTEVARFTARTDSEVSLPSGTRARYFLVWITQLAEAEGGADEGDDSLPFRAEIAEVEFFS